MVPDKLKSFLLLPSLKTKKQYIYITFKSSYAARQHPLQFNSPNFCKLYDKERYVVITSITSFLVALTFLYYDIQVDLI